jgi:hypothetical protein
MSHPLRRVGNQTAVLAKLRFQIPNPSAKVRHGMTLAPPLRFRRALACFVVCADNVLRRIEGQEDTIFLWVSSGRWELIVVSGMLSVLMQLLFWSQVVDPGNRRTHRG